MTAIEQTDEYKATRKLVLKKLTLIGALNLVAAIAGMASFLGLAKPEGQELEMWFARTGSLITVLALLSQIRSTELFEILSPRGLGSRALFALRGRYGLMIRIANWSGIGTAVAGTIIWGYGDLLMRAFG